VRFLDKPKVYLVGEPSIRRDVIEEYLVDIGGRAWMERLVASGAWTDLPDAGLLVEFMGRLCYKSWEPGLNKNVTKVREDHNDYVLNVLQSGHGSVIAHAYFNFVIRGGSRVFTAEMNRHKAGTEISEQSLRFVRLDDIEFWEPPGLHPETYQEGRELIARIEQFMTNAYERELPDGMPFSEKKKITSKLRRWAPLGLATEEGWTANIRAIRHVIEMRTAPGAEEEIRIIAHQIASIMHERLPAFFDDYTRAWDADSSTPVAAWLTEHRKV